MYRAGIVKRLGEHEFLNPGHPACHGCGISITLRHVLKAAGKDTILVVPAGCTSIVAGTLEKATFGVPLYHTAFAASPAVASGIVEALERRGKGNVNVIVWAGDGGTYDIGFASLSGAAERGHNILYICHDNEAYMNTGIQRSGGTPRGAWTTTTWEGKREAKKDLFRIMISHRIPYVATATPAYPLDLYNKVKKALSIKGFKFIHVLNPCPPGWRIDTSMTIEVAKKAVLSGAWILMEYENGKLKLNPPSSNMLEERRVPLEDYLRLQGRFKHLFKPENKWLLEMLKKDINEMWEWIKKKLQEQEGT